MRMLAIAALVALAAAHVHAGGADFTWDKSCGTQYDRLNTQTLSMVPSSGSKWAPGVKAVITTHGSTDLHVPLLSGAWVVDIYELGLPKKVASDYGDLTDAVHFTDSRNTTFEGTFTFVMPPPRATGNFTASLTATDQSKAAYFCIEIHYLIPKMGVGAFDALSRLDELEARVEALEGARVQHIPGSYCMNDPTKSPPYYCHLPIGNCKTDEQCIDLYGKNSGSYCMNGVGKVPPYSCHVPEPTVCRTDADC